MHETKAFVSKRLADRDIVLKGDLERRISAEQLVGPFPA